MIGASFLSNGAAVAAVEVANDDFAVDVVPEDVVVEPVDAGDGIIDSNAAVVGGLDIVMIVSVVAGENDNALFLANQEGERGIIEFFLELNLELVGFVLAVGRVAAA